MHSGQDTGLEGTGSEGTRLARSPLARCAWLVAGCLCVALAFVGTLLPLLPTTPFLLLAAYAFARSSPRLYARLSRHPTYGPLIRDWRAGRGIPPRAKAIGVASVVATIGFSATFVVSSAEARLALAVVGVGVCTFLLTRRTSRGAA